MGNRATKKKDKGIKFDTNLNKKIADVLIFNNEDLEYSNNLRLNRSKTKHNDRISASINKETINIQTKYRLKSKSKDKQDPNKSIIKENLLDDQKIPEEVEMINITNKILTEIFNINKPFYGSGLNYYNAFFYNNIYQKPKEDRNELRKSRNSNVGNSISLRRTSGVFQSYSSQSEYNKEQIKYIRRMFNLRKIIKKSKVEENLNISQEKFYNNNNIFNMSIINNLSSSFNLSDNNLLRRKSEEKIIKNSISLSPKNNQQSDIEKDNSNFILNTSQDNINNDYFYNENNEKSILDRSNVKNSNYFNNEFDFYEEDKGNLEKEKIKEKSVILIQNQSLINSREKSKKPYIKRTYNKPPVVRVKMDMKDFIKDDVQEQSFYRQNRNYRINNLNKSGLKSSQNNTSNGNINNDKFYDLKKLNKTKINNTHLDNRKFADIIGKFTQINDYKEKFDKRKKLKDIDYNRAQARKREAVKDYCKSEENQNQLDDHEFRQKIINDQKNYITKAIKDEFNFSDDIDNFSEDIYNRDSSNEYRRKSSGKNLQNSRYEKHEINVQKKKITIEKEIRGGKNRIQEENKSSRNKSDELSPDFARGRVNIQNQKFQNNYSNNTSGAEEEKEFISRINLKKINNKHLKSSKLKISESNNSSFSDGQNFNVKERENEEIINRFREKNTNNLRDEFKGNLNRNSKGRKYLKKYKNNDSESQESDYYEAKEKKRNNNKNEKKKLK